MFSHLASWAAPSREASSAAENELGLEVEDAELFQRLVRIINQETLRVFQDRRLARKFLLAGKSGNVNKYWRIRDLIRDSRSRDVSYELNRWLGSHRDIAGVNEIYEQILKRGYKSEAVRCLRSLSPEEMKYGPADQTPAQKRQVRMARAEEFAGKAGVQLKQIAQEHNLEDLFNG